MQFSGLQDINEKDIYEGDILKPTWTESDRSVYLVEWNEEKAGFYSIFYNYGERIDSHTHSHYLSGECMEIIGNIWQNPELLKAKE